MGLINGLQFSPQGPSIHHLLFVDDSLFICKALENQCSAFKDILDIYGRATGQTINLDKSSITFGSKIVDEVKVLIRNKMGIVNEGGAGSYLGLPECFSGSKVDMLEYIHGRLKSRLSGWFARFLSQGGKEVLIKSIAMAMPVYAMSCFRLPKSTCESLSSAMASFWWNSFEHHKKIHWVSWSKLCLPKDKGGLGFKDIQLFNQALLAKQAWRLLNNPLCLFSRFMRSRYFVDTPFLEAKVGSRPSYAWRSILHGRALLEKGLRQGIGNGASMGVWTSRWIQDDVLRAQFMKNILVDLSLKVKDLIDPSSKGWDAGSLQEHFFQRDQDLIRKIKPATSSEDFMVWLHNKSGFYSVRSGYWLASQDLDRDTQQDFTALPSLSPIKDLIWELLGPSKIKMFLWKAVCGAVPVALRLLTRGVKLDTRCQICGFEGETINHMMFTCPLARQFWALSNIPSPEDGFAEHSLYHNIHYVLLMTKNVRISIATRRSIPWFLWSLWKNRNNLVFEGMVFLLQSLIRKSQDDSEKWFLAQQVQKEEDVNLGRSVGVRKVWKPPDKPWLKCNLASTWDSRNRVGGAAWVLRNSSGVVLLHSRRSFSGLLSKQEAELECWLWTFESMRSLKIRKVVFAAEAKYLLEAVLRSSAWPSFKAQSESLRLALSFIPFWRLQVEDRCANKGAFLIAKSVTSEDRRQSYVASGYPF